MEDKFEFTFNNGVIITIILGEDGYTVNVLDVKPLMGTFTSFENMLYGIAQVVQDAVSDNIEFGMFTSSLYFNFAEQDPSVKELQDEISEILLK